MLPQQVTVINRAGAASEDKSRALLARSTLGSLGSARRPCRVGAVGAGRQCAGSSTRTSDTPILEPPGDQGLLDAEVRSADPRAHRAIRAPFGGGAPAHQTGQIYVNGHWADAMDGAKTDTRASTNTWRPSPVVVKPRQSPATAPWPPDFHDRQSLRRGSHHGSPKTLRSQTNLRRTPSQGAWSAQAPE